MGYRRRAGGGKRDLAEAAILDALRACGVQTWQLSGTGCPDLLCRAQGRWVPLEVKTGKGRLTVNQQTIAWAVVTTPDEALRAVGLGKL